MSTLFLFLLSCNKNECKVGLNKNDSVHKISHAADVFIIMFKNIMTTKSSIFQNGTAA